MMTLQWVAIAFFLYAEVALTLLLILPLLKPSTWKWIFGLQVFSALRPVWTTVYYAILLILVVLFIDAIRIIYKYGGDMEVPGMTLDAKIDWRLKDCRGQRNFYITGFALFLILVIRRLISMISSQATLEASHTATLRQARNANAELQRRIEQEEQQQRGEEGEGEKTKKTKGPTQEEYDALQTELTKARADVTAMKKQAESTSAEYDRLAEEHQKLQSQVNELEGEPENKKDQ